jgi:hypothetical protein
MLARLGVCTERFRHTPSAEIEAKVIATSMPLLGVKHEGGAEIQIYDAALAQSLQSQELAALIGGLDLSASKKRIGLRRATKHA